MSTTKQKRTREQVHQDGGHTTFVASCSTCVTEAEANRQAEIARQEQPATETAEPAAPVASTGSAPARADDGRPQCKVHDCVLPEFIEGIGVCGGHYATHRGYANKRSG